jgi:hypothetical protein
MPQTPDRFPGEREDEGIKLDVGIVRPTQNGELYYVSGEGFRFFEEGVERGLGTGGSVDFNRIVLDTDGRIIYTGDGDIVLKT